MIRFIPPVEFEWLEQSWRDACAAFLHACFSTSSRIADISVLGAEVMAARARLDRAREVA